MQYSVEEIKQYAAEEDVKFIRMAFCDAAGRQKNIAIMPEELDRAFQYGIAIDGSAIPGFGGEVHSDLLLRPGPIHPLCAALAAGAWTGGADVLRRDPAGRHRHRRGRPEPVEKNGRGRQKGRTDLCLRNRDGILSVPAGRGRRAYQDSL